MQPTVNVRIVNIYGVDSKQSSHWFQLENERVTILNLADIVFSGAIFGKFVDFVAEFFQVFEAAVH